MTIFDRMGIREFAKFYKVAQDEALKERHYQAWCACLPFMSKDTFISFSDYHNKLTGKNLDTRPAEDILSEVEEIRRNIHGNVTV